MTKKDNSPLGNKSRKEESRPSKGGPLEEETRPVANKPRREEIEKPKDLPYEPDITREDEMALPDKGLSMNQDEDRFLKEREKFVDFEADNLDIPGRNEPDTTSQGSDIPDEDNRQFNQRGKRKDERKDLDHPGSDKPLPS